MNIPFGFKLHDMNFESFRKELNKGIIELALNSLSSEYLLECFNIFNENETHENNSIKIRKRYEEILVDIKKVEESGFRNFSIPDVLTKIIYLKKDSVYYGIIDSDEVKIKDFFFSHKNVEYFTPHAWDISDEERESIKNVWSVLMPSLLDRKGDYFVLEDNVFIYPTFYELIKYAKDTNYLESSVFYSQLLSDNVFSILMEELENETKREKNVEVLTYELLNKREIVKLLNNKKLYNESYFKDYSPEKFNSFKEKYIKFINLLENV